MADDDVRVIHGDCLAVLPTLAGEPIAAVVTDPPYGVRGEDWDDMDDSELAAFCMAWLSQARRISKELIVFCNQDHVIYDLCLMLHRRVRRLVWYKPPGSQYAGGRECGLWFSYETILHCHGRESWSVVEPKSREVAEMIREARKAAGLSRGAVDTAVRGKKTGLCYRWEEAACLPTSDQVAKLVPLLGLDGDFHAAFARASVAKADTVAKARAMASENAADGMDVFAHRTVTNGRHPCEKPLRLMIELIERLTNPGDLILDPFAGSGTTGVAALKTGRRAILIEKDERYIPVIERRIAEARTPLFDAIEAGEGR